MKPICYARPTSVEQAVSTVTSRPATVFLAGGTTLVDMLRIGAMEPDNIVDITWLPLGGIAHTPDGGLRIGALATMSEVAAEPGVIERYPFLSVALWKGASAQLRNMATMGGNLMQKVRCSYFREPGSACDKRDPGSGCDAVDGLHRGHAILGTGPSCFATHPSDVAIPLVALDATVTVWGPRGERSIGFDDFFLLPGTTPHLEHPIAADELITRIDVPALPFARNSHYLKVRDRESYEFALASAAVAMSIADGTVLDVRIGLGGVATKPWRARIAEQMLIGVSATRENFTKAAATELQAADTSHPMNAFKRELAVRTLVRALETVRPQHDSGGTR
ncbi:FAD binding domain-containing protein [Nocardia seriolae]|uniref:FAD-binding molybdopterin dehydrogenase n=1 Tax=Nocardia seriolae TaxID=37332 RepID=A0ABC8B1G0_9NOCA|nr:xanthine dehydrogenase family protein subunit M [Nocardia seriolae]APB00314.1 Xanthine dehydrogenase [Nocardia seriolae]OJF79355.1 FAD-binding molybdopterin dehydrogenase [Nocardia seriolae]PSK30431.1 xanthine dehydrogenase family protein subunit M [Nocardia seriolae]QOW36740.1 xanthine dehydrogenase family protein subunit M [Nocardia seriolae]QUN15743.1 xanthine dehydrogenase family protein subunit M [Nocardia seriolae]